MDYRTKKDFIHDLRVNGYSVNERKVKESELFKYIIERTECSKWDWKLTKIPQED